MKLATSVLLLACALGTACGRSLVALTPTQQLNAQHQTQQQQQLAAAGAAASAAARHIAPPCYIPQSYYPYRTCVVATDVATCARGYNAWKTNTECCMPQNGPLGAFPLGCTDFAANISCWTIGAYFPKQTCFMSSDISVCSRNWAQWPTEAACCAPNSAFPDGCTKPEPCFTAATYYPARTCAQTQDQAICNRGWGAFPTVDDCCALGAAFSDGCGPVATNDSQANVTVA